MAVINGSQGATALVDIADCVVGVQVLVGHEWWLYVETAADVVGCAGCGTRAVGHGRAPTKVRDLPVSGRPAVLVWHKQRWRCPDSDCETTTWSETCPEIAPRASLTGRARARLAEMVNVGGDSVAAAAAAFGVGWHTAHQAVIDHTDPAVDDAGRLEGCHGDRG